MVGVGEFASEGCCDLVVVDDEVAGFGVGFDVGCFAGSGWSDDEGDVCC